MEDHVYKLTEVVGTSHESSDDAIRQALARAAKSIRNIRWFEVIANRGFLDQGGKVQYQVTLKIGFNLED
ncbi:MAG: dodecin family protein [Caenibius sp.]